MKEYIMKELRNVMGILRSHHYAVCEGGGPPPFDIREAIDRLYGLLQYIEEAMLEGEPEVEAERLMTHAHELHEQALKEFDRDPRTSAEYAWKAVLNATDALYTKIRKRRLPIEKRGEEVFGLFEELGRPDLRTQYFHMEARLHRWVFLGGDYEPLCVVREEIAEAGKFVEEVERILSGMRNGENVGS